MCVCACMHAYMHAQSLSCVQLFATPLTAACQGPLSVGLSQQENWSGLPFLSSGDLPDPGIKLWSPALQADSLPTELPGKPHHASAHISALLHST